METIPHMQRARQSSEAKASEDVHDIWNSYLKTLRWSLCNMERAKVEKRMHQKMAVTLRSPGW